MVLIRLFILALLVLAPAAAPTAAQAAGLFKPAVHDLENGMRIIVVENHRAPVALHMLWYKVGSADEEPQDGGIAHFLEHMMFKGTRQNPDQDYSAAIAALGGEDNAFTSTDYTAFFARVHPRQLEAVMRMEAERITDLELDDEDIRIEQGVVQQERAQRMEATASDRFRAAVSEAFYGTHPYARPVIGTRDTIAAYTARSVENFYEEHYAPNNVIAIVVGDVKAADVFKLADEIYGPLRAADIAPRVRAGDILAQPLRITRSESGVQQPQLLLMWPAVSAAQNPRDALALQVLVETLSTPDGVLQQKLVFQNNIAVSLGVSYDSDRLNGSALALSASPHADVSMGKLEGDLLKAWHKALDNISDTAINRAKQRLLDTAALARDNIHTPAYVFGMALTTGQTIAEVEHWPRHIAAVNTRDVRRLAAQFKETPRLTAQLLPAGKPQ